MHHILGDEVDGQKEEQGDQRKEDEEEEVNGDVEAIRETHNAHETWMWWCGVRTQTWANAVWYHLNKENSQGTLTTEESTLTTKELQCMMPSCRLASELRSQIIVRIKVRCTCHAQKFPSTSGHFTHCWTCRPVCTGIPIHLLSMHQTCSLLICAKIPCREKIRRVSCGVHISWMSVNSYPLFLTRKNGSFFVNRDALGEMMTGSAPVSFVQGAAQVSSWLRVPCPSSVLPDSWRFVSNSLLNLNSSLLSWISFTKRSVYLGITT